MRRIRSRRIRARKSLDRALDSRLPPYDSSVDLLHREVTVCYAYLCQFAYACNQKSRRPAKVLKRRCMRYLPDTMRVEPSLSDHVLDMLALSRDKGSDLASQTVALLDRVRPDGPLRKRA